MVVYFSGTGNSKYCATVLASGLQDELLDSASYIKNGIAADLISGKPWVFVSPTYAWQLPRVFEAFIRSGSFSGNRDAYFLMTCGDDIGNADQYLKKLCKQIGLRYCGVMPLVMPENYIAMFSVPDEKEITEIIAAAKPSMSEAVACIRQGCPFDEPEVDLTARLKSGLINRLFYRFCVKSDPFYVTEACIGCGKCVKQCVCKNISLINDKPVWGENCTHCMACICGCPKTAIEYGKKSLGKPRYQCPK